MKRSLTCAVLAAAVLAGCGKKEEALEPRQGASWTAQKAREFGSVACSLAPSQSALFRYLETATASGAGAATALATAIGLTAVRHSSGSYIFTGSTGYVAHTLSVAGFGPALVKVAVGTAAAAVVLELICVKTNHPALVARLDDAARDFYRRAISAATSTATMASVRLGPPLHKAQRVVIREMSDAFDQSSGATVALTGAVLRQLK